MEPLIHDKPIETLEEVSEVRMKILRAMALQETRPEVGRGLLVGLADIEKGLKPPTGGRRPHRDEHDWAKHIRNETVDEVLKICVRKREGALPTEIKPMSGRIAGVIVRYTQELVTEIEKLKKPVRK